MRQESGESLNFLTPAYVSRDPKTKDRRKTKVRRVGGLNYNILPIEMMRQGGRKHNTISHFPAIDMFFSRRRQSPDETLWGFYHTARNQSSQGGTSTIGPDTAFPRGEGIEARDGNWRSCGSIIKVTVGSLHDPHLRFMSRI